MGVSPSPLGQQLDLLAELIGGPTARESAECLLQQFGSLGRVMSSSTETIKRVIGDGTVADRIRVARAAVLAAQREDIARATVDVTDPRLQRYIIGLFNGVSTERLHVIFLDAQHRYLSDETIAEGSGAHLFGNMRTLVSRAFEMGAGGLILAHNHPSGQARPSEADLRETVRLVQSLRELELALIDHLIVGGSTIHSMRGAGLL